MRIEPGGVKVAEATLKRSVQDGHCLLFVTTFTIDQALAAKAENGELRSGLTKGSGLHDRSPLAGNALL
jgi:hypothetical protein